MRPDNPFLRSARLKKGWTAQEVSTRLGVSLATYRRWESGQQIPRLASLRALCTLFGHSREELGFPFIPLLARGERATSDSPEGEAPLPTDPLERWGISIGYAWQAYMAGAQADLERLLLTYMANLAAPTLAPGPRQQQAAGLLAQVYQLRALLELERGDFVAAQLNGTQALVYSQLAQDPNLYMASQLRLATIFTAYKRPGSALHAYTEALRCANEREGVISPLLRSWAHAGVAVLLTSMGRDEALASLEAALAWFPETPEQDPSFAYTRWDESLLYLYEGQMFLRIGQPQEPWEAFAHIDELQPAPAERVRAEVLRLKAYTSCVLGHMIQSCIYLEAARKRGT